MFRVLSTTSKTVRLAHPVVSILYAVGSKHGNEAQRIHTDVHGVVLFLEKKHFKRRALEETYLRQGESGPDLKSGIRMTCKIQWGLTCPRIHLW